MCEALGGENEAAAGTVRVADMSSQKLVRIKRASEGQEPAEGLREEIVGGLLYCHHRANSNTSKTLEVSAFTYALIELLVEKGLLTEAELNERKQEAGKRLVEKFTDSGMGVEIQESKIDKYHFDESPRIDCENRIHLCKAACCRLRFPLSRQDIEEGVVRWNLAHPYLIARRADGYCNHVDEATSQCTVYEQRPLPCRSYDCRNDERIWEDFESRTVSPSLQNLFEV
ncbi:MAG TPA: YkgJ family cysteine cluster protein [Blastocatellia bacterium]|nr:YkgJ family cysteine cluster protein [Blastocatellia bacterium]